MTTTDLRRAVAADAPAVRKLVRDAFGVYVERIGREPFPMTVDYPAAIATGHCWVIELDNRITGVMLLVPAADHLLVDVIAVTPDLQGHGLGARLLAHAEQQARELGLSRLELYTNEAMTENLAYYPRLGFEETHRGTENGFHRVFFTKAVTA